MPILSCFTNSIIALRQFEYNQKLMDSIAQELVMERNDKMHINESLKVLKNENKVLTRQLGALNTRKAALEKRTQELQQDKEVVQNKLKSVETMLTDKIAQIDLFKEQLSAIQRGRTEASTAAPASQAAAVTGASADRGASVELAPIVVRPQDDMPSAKANVAVMNGGKVLAVNKENNFVVIDVGENQGTKIGDTFQILRNGQVIATVEAIQVRKDIAACDIKKQSASPRIGDAAQ